MTPELEPAVARLPRRAIRPGLALGLVGAVGIAHAVLLYDDVFEDAFITYRYADHLAHGAGLTYNAGEVVEGFTSFGWTVLLAALSWSGLPIVATSRALSLVFALALLWVTTLTARRWTGRDESLWTVAPALLVVANGTWAFYAMTGMETTLFALLVSAGIFFASGAGRRSGFYAGLALGASALVRPEGVGYFAAISAALLIGTDAQSRWRHLLVPMAAVFGAIFAPYFAWRWHHFGYLLPNTYYAKASLSATSARTGAAQIEAYLTAHLCWLVPLAIGYLVHTKLGSRKGWAVAALVCGAAVVNVILVGGDIFPFDRFLLPAIPAGAIAIASAFGAFAQRRPEGSSARAGLAAGFVALAGGTFAVELVPLHTFLDRRPLSERGRVLGVRAIDDDYQIVGDWLRGAFPGKTIAVNAAGIVPFLSGLETIDMLGLNDVHIAHAPALGTAARGHEKHDGHYVLGRKPDLVLLGLPTLKNRPLRAGELDAAVGRWFPFLPGDREIYEDPSFRRDYAPRGVEIAPGKFLLLFIRQPASAE